MKWQQAIEQGAETESVGQLTDGEFVALAKGAETPEVYSARCGPV